MSLTMLHHSNIKCWWQQSTTPPLRLQSGMDACSSSKLSRSVLVFPCCAGGWERQQLHQPDVGVVAGVGGFVCHRDDHRGVGLPQKVQACLQCTLEQRVTCCVDQDGMKAQVCMTCQAVTRGIRSWPPIRLARRTWLCTATRGVCCTASVGTATRGVGCTASVGTATRGVCCAVPVCITASVVLPHALRVRVIQPTQDEAALQTGWAQQPSVSVHHYIAMWLLTCCCVCC
jgi:hypothetical protein